MKEMLCTHERCTPKTFVRSGVEPVAPSSVAYPHDGHARWVDISSFADEGDDRAICGDRVDRVRVRRRDVWFGRCGSAVDENSAGLAGHRHVGPRVRALLFCEDRKSVV